MEKNTCKKCIHFRQHYGLDERRLFKLYCGHCVLPGVRRKKPDTVACEKFEEVLQEENAFATKEYLSKELLTYLLNLPLLPKIEDATDEKIK